MSMNLEESVMLLMLVASVMVWVISFACAPGEADAAHKTRRGFTPQEQEEHKRASGMLSICYWMGVISSIAIGLIFMYFMKDLVGTTWSVIMMIMLTYCGFRIIVSRVRHPRAFNGMI